jgi:hypothetical protein
MAADFTGAAGIPEIASRPREAGWRPARQFILEPQLDAPDGASDR